MCGSFGNYNNEQLYSLHWHVIYIEIKRFPNKILKTGCVVDLIGSARYLKLYYIKTIFAFETLIKNDDMSDFTAVITNTVHYILKLLLDLNFCKQKVI